MSETRRRIESVDFLRGFVMIVMALDHTRDFFGSQAVSPTDPAHAGAALFFTRWVTHICAPTFFLLTGTSAFLAQGRMNTAALSRFLVTRGAWLIVAELTVVRLFSYQFNFDFHVTMFVVLWALGWAMIVLGVLVYLPLPVIIVFGAVLVAGHNLLDSVRWTNPVWVILHRPGFVSQNPDHTIFAAYPLIPWIGVTALGYALGAMFAWSAERRRKALLAIGVTAIVAFVVLRAINVYGDPAPWRVQATSVATVLAFLNANKYPPSLQFLLMTLGPSLLILRWADGVTLNALRPVLEYGRVPFFYYAVHFCLIHMLAVVACLAHYGTAHWMFESNSLSAYPFTQPPGWGYSLPVVWGIWIGVVLTMYPACRAFASLKARRKNWWLSYL